MAGSVLLISRHGKIVHHKLMWENPDPEPLGNPINNYAAPSCALDEDAVYVTFGTYGTARLDPRSAEIVWQRRDIHAIRRLHHGDQCATRSTGDVVDRRFRYGPI